MAGRATKLFYYNPDRGRVLIATKYGPTASHLVLEVRDAADGHLIQSKTYVSKNVGGRFLIEIRRRMRSEPWTSEMTPDEVHAMRMG